MDLKIEKKEGNHIRQTDDAPTRDGKLQEWIAPRLRQISALTDTKSGKYYHYPGEGVTGGHTYAS